MIVAALLCSLAWPAAGAEPAADPVPAAAGDMDVAPQNVVTPPPPAVAAPPNEVVRPPPLAVVVVGPAAAQPGPPPRPAPFSAAMLVQMRYQETAVTVYPGLQALVTQQYSDPAVSADTLRLIRDTARERDGLRPRRILLDSAGELLDGLSWQVRLDFARLIYEDPTQLVRWAFAEAGTTKPVALTVGIFDIPFSLFETMDEAAIELAERGPTHELLAHMRFAERDLGALVTVSPLRERQRLQLVAGALEGGATGGQSYRGPGLLVGRLVVRPSEHLQIGAGVAWRPRPLTAWWEELRFYYTEYDKGHVYGVDASLSFRRFALRGEWVAGARTDNDVAVPVKERRGDARTFMSGWIMALLRFRVRGVLVTPAGRAELLDTDREHPTGAILHLSAALNVDVSERIRVLADLSRHYVQIGTRNWEFDRVRYDTDALTGVLQVQVRL